MPAGTTGSFHLDLRRVTAYPVGVALAFRGTNRGIGFDPSRARRWLDGLDLTVAFADGRRAGLRDSAGMKSGNGPMLALARETVLSGSGGSGRDLTATLRLWVWPLPPAGPLTVRCRWPDVGLDEATFVLDAGAVRAALGDAAPPAPAATSATPTTPTGVAATPADTRVPDLVGMDVGSARVAAAEALLFLEHADPDGPPLASGTIRRQEPSAGSVVVPYSRVVAWATGEIEGPPDHFDPWPDEGGPGPGGGGPPTRDREPRRPAPTSGRGRASADDRTSTNWYRERETRASVG
ncbi:MAG: PASTA domain-containing protein, partial [Acidimicrobiales bacterium]